MKLINHTVGEIATPNRMHFPTRFSTGTPETRVAAGTTYMKERNLPNLSGGTLNTARSLLQLTVFGARVGLLLYRPNPRGNGQAR